MLVRRKWFDIVLFRQNLRAELDKLLQRKIEVPGLDIYAEGKGVVSAAIELLHSQNVSAMNY